MKRNGLRALVLLAVVAAFATGCTLFQGQIERIAPITQTTEFFDGANEALAYIQIYGDTTFHVDWGDETPEQMFVVDGHLQIDHAYESAGVYDVLIIAKNGQRYDARVTVETDPPIVRFPFYLDNYWDIGQRVTFNIPERSVGCDGATGVPQYISGITPGAGTTEFRMTAYDKDGYKVPLFDRFGNNVWGEWIELVDDISELQLLYIFLGWYEANPPYPGPFAQSMALDHMGCTTPDDQCGDDGCDGNHDWELPPIPDDALYVDITIEGRNEWMAEPYPSATRRIHYDGGCE